MLYGYKETVDNRIATLVVAADTGIEFDDFIATVSEQDAVARHFDEIYTSNFLQHMTEELYKGYKKPIHCFYHNSADQRDAFVLEWNIKEVPPVGGRDRQTDMQFADQKTETNLRKQIRDAAEAQAEERGEEFNDGQPHTIEELYGLDKEDRWDRRSEEERAEDAEMKKKMKELSKQGKISGDDSFTGGKHGKGANAGAANDGTVHVTDVKSSINEDGSIDIDSIRAVKVGGAVDEELKAANIAAHEEKVTRAKGGKTVFTPEDFAAILRGDGSADHLDVKGDDPEDRRRQGKPIERGSLSEGAEQARREYQEEEQRKLKDRARQMRREADVKAKHEREQGIFRGADLAAEDTLPWAELSEELQQVLEANDAKADEVAVKDYPYNSELGGRAVLPMDDMSSLRGTAAAGVTKTVILGGANANILGTISVGNVAAAVVERVDATEPGYVVYGHLRVVEEEGDLISKITASVVRIR